MTDNDDRRQPKSANASGVEGDRRPDLNPIGRGEHRADRPPAHREQAAVQRLLGAEGTSQRVPASKSWESPGHFATTADEFGRTTIIEGWLSHRAGERSANDASLQRRFRQEYQLTKNQCVFHVLGHEHGGPTSEMGGAESAVANFVAADRLINVSHHRLLEQQITADLKAGMGIYCRAEIRYSDCEPASRLAERITYTYFIADGQNKPTPYGIREYMVRTDKTPGVRVENSTRGTTAAQSLHESRRPGFYDRRYQEENSH